MKFLPDGKILLSGATFADQLGIHFCLFQLNADGSVDETFGDKGLYVYYLGGDYEHLYNTCFQSDEKIYHLPFDQQYDKAMIDISKGERWVKSIKEAEDFGFRRAWRWNANKGKYSTN